MKGGSRALVLALTLALAAPAFAVQPDEMLDDPALEARARALSRDVRCLVCRNENIDDSNAPLARDLRILLRERLTAGDSDAEVKEFLVSRYGEFVLLRPRFSAHTAMLWFGPLGVLGLGILLARGIMRRRAGALAPEPEAPLTEEDRERLRELLGEEGGKGS
ncbi:cytochrome c-type biogenesis protein [Neomegalonema sp.]|uniref:cytochrome c-type biogenesis protein n=1 Tax=Neomegalonema sp. TaxID=2039713 RepID=UPI002620C198|nr:cytochrome c-type biogenesis protein [Neomegalonema sp.]MDD2868764.1 cytochrome c-type biogenesis protein CcmH [Neomegalonema sp.]